MLSRRKFIVKGSQAMIATPIFSSSIPALASQLLAPGLITLQLPCGKLQGQRSSDTQRYLGIPFAQPPLGELRFRAPRPLADWQGVREATCFAKASLQPPRPAKLVPEDPGYAEDCLYLNVWAPNTPGPHPVYVWIHGGANAAGTTAQPIFDGESFARRGVVFVSIAYRLGVLGFVDVSSLLGDEYRGSGNNGLLDQVEALRWIQRNISAFGGDPQKVTIGGESAGGKNVISLMSMPLSKGLFHRAICQSGGGQTYADREVADDLANRVMSELESTGGKAQGLLNASTDALLAAQAAVIEKYPAKSPFRAVIDGVVLHDVPLKAIAQGMGKEIPLLLGSNKDEAAFYGPSKKADGKVTTADLANMQLKHFNSIFAKYSALYPDADAEALRYKAVTAESYGIPTVRLAEARAKTGSPVFCYRFDLAPENGPFKGLCVHTSELPLVFGNVHLPTAAATGPVEPAAHRMSSTMHGMWVEFISGKGELTAEGIAWPAYSMDLRKTMIFADQARVVEDPSSAERQLWKTWQPVASEV
ncbi:carboxylesterase/lipase family protein [Pseudomonas putida]|nr:carboxylesterase/lipase family protein [Pseudomonas putida]